MTAAFRKPATILVVEDDRATREALAAVLAGAGYTVLTAADGQEALDSFGVIVIPDLILLDMLMPRLDGWQFIAAFKQRLGPAAGADRHRHDRHRRVGRGQPLLRLPA